MIVPEDVRKCVAFLGIQRTDGKFALAGSVFWLAQYNEGDDKAAPVYAVTARHVIDKIRSKGVQDAWFRLNDTHGSLVLARSPLKDWYFHPRDSSLDVAILPMGFAPNWDHMVVPYSRCITDELMSKNEVGLGDEVFITGLFRHHHGSRRNIPIVRVGNIACFSEEKVVTEGFGPMDALLVEARSIGGLSGSPVFLNLGVTRMIGGKVVNAQANPIFYLLGLVHGHYDTHSTHIDDLSSDSLDNAATEKVNTGIAIVVPIHCVRAVIDAYEAEHEDGDEISAAKSPTLAAT